MNLSIVIPAYNSAPWLPSTLAQLVDALTKTRLHAEIIVVDDGSTDDTAQVVRTCATNLPVPLRLVSQPENCGVFLARRLGATEARFARMLLLDSRVLIAPAALQHLEVELSQKFSASDAEGIENVENLQTRIAHITTASDAPLVGRFWDTLTHAFWGRYLRNPQRTLMTSENFDSVPKGTGCMLVNTAVFLAACAQITAPAALQAQRFISDDTRLLRYLAQQQPMLLDPEFRAIYRPRTTVRRFLAHAFLRGTLFIDSYYGTTPLRTLLLWLVAFSVPAAIMLPVIVLLGGSGALAAVLLGAAFAAFLLLVAGVVVVAARNRAEVRALAAFIVYAVPFAGAFWAGVVRGLRVRRERVAQ